MIYYNSKSDQGIKARALLDAGSQGSLLTTELAGRLGLQLEPTHELIKGVGGSKTPGTVGRTRIIFSPINKQFPRITTPVVCMNNIVDKQPVRDLDKSILDLTTGLTLADPHFYTSRPVDLLLGSDVFGTLVGGDKIVLQPEGLTAYSTIFGYVILGRVKISDDTSELVDTSEFFCLSVSDTLQRFWEVEEPPSSVVDPTSNPLDVECETFYKDNILRLDSGQFMIRLPFLSARSCLGESKSIAEKRFLALERKFSKNSSIHEKYVQFMREYLNEGHMSVFDFDFNSEVEYYVIPHHAVVKTVDDVVKLRVVFDGSCPSSNGVSLNDCLHRGPKLHKDITEILINFRRHQVVFVADIRMMFRQTLIAPADRRYQLVLWRESPDAPLLTYCLNTNTYGLRSSPYIAIRTLVELANREHARFPQAAAVIEHDIYVDDILTGAENSVKALALQQELIQLMRSAGYELRKWISNDPCILQNLPEEYLQVPHLFDNPENKCVAVLGILYNPIQDEFSYRIQLDSVGTVTKRKILSIIARMYDPSGWITPVIFWAKCFLQRLWLRNIAWDDSLDEDLKRDWLNFQTDLINVENIKIPRCILPTTTNGVSIHGFSDASESGFAAVVYLRTVTNDEVITVRLLMAKSKVAPVRSRLTIPKLELCGALLLYKLLLHVCLCLQRTIKVEDIFGWTDSSIVLSWINTSPHTLQVFEANRVSQIQNSPIPISWRHISGRLNPADCASRGCSATGLVSHVLWWGPEWLQKAESYWPNTLPPSPPELPGIRCFLMTMEVTQVLDSLLEKYSSFDKLIAVTAWVRRFISYCRNKIKRKPTCYLTAQERKASIEFWVSYVQKTHFSTEIENLRRGKQIKGPIKRLNPFLDSEGLLRVGGRIKNSDLPFEARHPLLLPKRGHFVKILISDLHSKNSHAGPNALLAILQRNYWVLSARRAVRNVTFKCISCYRLKGITSQPLMGDLPRDRVVAVRPFHGVGTDFAGPFLIKSHKLRNAKIYKSYLCIFVCLATKAVHLEVVSDLSTEAFIASLTRLVSRRGLPALIRSDCGTNFKGGDRYLKEVTIFLEQNQNAVGDNLSRRGITWLFNPPGCPSWGGLFEAAVKSAKTHLRRVIGESVLTFEELSTIFCKIEAVLNSRPLCPLSSDPNDLEALTPGHFLIGQALNAVPEHPLQDLKLYKLSRFQLLQQISQRFWHRWHLEYLHILQQRLRWTDSSHPPKEGDLVLLKEENISPLNWRRGRILKLYAGKDGVFRLADVKTHRGVVVQRAVAKLSRLPID